jgi:uncharacterized membrane protein YuzA (DUF378 family)
MKPGFLSLMTNISQHIYLGGVYMEKMNALDWIALILVIVGGLNWGLFAFGYDLVDLIFGSVDILAKAIYVLVGLSALYMIYYAVKASK